LSHFFTNFHFDFSTDWQYTPNRFPLQLPVEFSEFGATEVTHEHWKSTFKGALNDI